MRLPERIICLTEETTELLYLLGEERRIVGISAYTVRPLRAREEKPVVSAFLSGSIPKIKALQPDLVIGFSDIQADLARDLIREGLQVLVTNPRSLEEIFSTMLLTGTLVGRYADALGLVEGWKARLASARTRAAEQKKRPRVFFQEWDDPLISGIRWVSELIEAAGGVEIFPELQSGAMAKERIVDAGEIARRNPEIYIGSWCGKPMDFAWVRSHPDLAKTSAVQADKIFEIDSSIILQPGPALFLEGLDAIERAVRSAD